MSKEDAALKEVQEMGTEGLNENAMAAISELADNDEGASIFLFITLNNRIAKLEKTVYALTNWDISAEDGVH